MIAAVLAPGGLIGVQELRSHVEAKARSAGHTLIGFHLRFTKALKHERFHMVNDQYRLAPGVELAPAAHSRSKAQEGSAPA